MPVGAILLALSLAACAPDPAPSPTPTGFASEEEAFAAAEATYRAYIDALNAVDLADPATFEPVAIWLRADALADSRMTLSELHAEGLRLVGATTFEPTRHVSAEPSQASVVVDICLDVSDVELLDPSGANIVPSDRPETQALRVEFAAARTPTNLAIFNSTTTELKCG